MYIVPLLCEGSCGKSFYPDQLTPWELNRSTSPTGVVWVDERLLCDDCWPKCSCEENVWQVSQGELCKTCEMEAIGDEFAAFCEDVAAQGEGR
jgi:hypothetical protein